MKEGDKTKYYTQLHNDSSSDTIRYTATVTVNCVNKAGDY
jgi:hypothetical protein